MDLPLAVQHKVSLYLMDMLSAGRVEEVKVSDWNTGQVFDTQSVSNFGMGTYLTWSMSGHIRVLVTFKSSPGPQTAVLSGLFFDPS